MNLADQLAQPEILLKIGKLNSAGMSLAGIRQMLRNENNIDANIVAIKRALNTYSIRGQEVLAGDKELKNEVRNIILDTRTQLKAINDLTWELIKEAKDQGHLNLRDAVPAIKELREQLKLSEDLIERMNSNIDYSKMGKVEMTQIIIEKLEILEKQGYIKVLNEPGKIIELETLKETKKEEEEDNGKHNDEPRDSEDN